MKNTQTVMKHLTQSVAHERAQLINTPISYLLFLKEEKSSKYEGILKITLSLKTQPTTLLVDYQGSTIHEVSVNNKVLPKSESGDYSQIWNGYNLLIPGAFFKAGENEIVIDFEKIN